MLSTKKKISSVELLLVLCSIQACLCQNGDWNFEEFKQLFEDVRGELLGLKNEINTLKNSNEILKQKIEQDQDFMFANFNKMRRVGNVAFIAANNERRTHNAQENVIFEEEIFDGAGNYDPGSGIFTCPETGIYFFSVTNMGTRSNSNYCIQVGAMETTCSHTSGSEEGHVSSVSAATRCDAGSQVSVRVITDGFSLYGEYLGMPTSSFTGALISLVV